MKPELKQKWIDALRSGQFKQGVANMKAEIKGGCEYCCLGVLREVAGREWIPRPEMSGAITYWPPKKFSDEGYLHPVEAEELGIDVEFAKDLAYRNDGSDGRRRHSFAAIADLIESKVPTE